MKPFMKMLPALGLVFGATLAMAMNVPTLVTEKTATKVWTPDSSQPNNYRDVTAIVESGNYECDQSQMDCLVEFSNDNPATGTPNILSEGEFIQL